MDEDVIYNQKGVLVSTTRFEAKGHTIAMAHVASVRVVHTDRSMLGVLMAVLGVLTAVLGFGLLRSSILAASGVGLVIAGITVAVALKRGGLLIRTSGGEIKTFTDMDRQFITEVSAAITRALIRRG